MATSFAALKARANDAVKRCLFDTIATINGATVSGMFSNEYRSVGLIGSSHPTFLCKTDDISQLINTEVLDAEVAITVNSTEYQLAGSPQHDGDGFTLLQLSKKY
jgi:hypothetical protein